MDASHHCGGTVPGVDVRATWGLSQDGLRQTGVCKSAGVVTPSLRTVWAATPPSPQPQRPPRGGGCRGPLGVRLQPTRFGVGQEMVCGGRQQVGAQLWGRPGCLLRPSVTGPTLWGWGLGGDWQRGPQASPCRHKTPPSARRGSRRSWGLSCPRGSPAVLSGAGAPGPSRAGSPSGTLPRARPELPASVPEGLRGSLGVRRGSGLVSWVWESPGQGPGGLERPFRARSPQLWRIIIVSSLWPTSRAAAALRPSCPCGCYSRTRGETRPGPRGVGSRCPGGAGNVTRFPPLQTVPE